MGKIWVCTDLHIGHKKLVSRLRSDTWKSVEDHDEGIFELWKQTVNKRDVVYMLGDMFWKGNMWRQLTALPGLKKLVMGNHDRFNVGEVSKYVHSVHGSIEKDEVLFTHIPIHPHELQYRWKYNVHGHLHEKRIDDWRYFNACPEQVGYAPVDLDYIKAVLAERKVINGSG